MSNAASLFLPGSNLTNLIVLHGEHVSGATFLLTDVAGGGRCNRVDDGSCCSSAFSGASWARTPAPTTVASAPRFGVGAIAVCRRHRASCWCSRAPALPVLVVGMAAVLLARDSAHARARSSRRARARRRCSRSPSASGRSAGRGAAPYALARLARPLADRAGSARRRSVLITTCRPRCCLTPEPPPARPRAAARAEPRPEPRRHRVALRAALAPRRALARRDGRRSEPTRCSGSSSFLCRSRASLAALSLRPSAHPRSSGSGRSARAGSRRSGTRSAASTTLRSRMPWCMRPVARQ